MSKSSPSAGFAEVITWGTKSTGGNGISDQIRSKLYGGNIGHTAIRLTIPIDKSGNTQKMIDELCFHEQQIVLPHTKKKLANGDEVFEVYISAWTDDKVTLDRDFVSDSLDELEGVHFDWDPKWADLVQTETRRYKGLIGKSVMTWGPEQIVHQRGKITDAEFQQISDIRTYQLNLKKYENYSLLSNRLAHLDTTRKSVNIGDTEKILLDKLFPKWTTVIKNPKKISNDELKNLINEVEKAREQFVFKDEYIANIQKISNITVKKIDELLKLVEQDIKKWGKISPETAQKIVSNKTLIFDKDQEITVPKLVGYSEADFAKLYQTLQKAKNNPNPQKMQSYFKYYIPENTQVLEQHYTIGLPPDHIVQIPLKSATPDLSQKEGLDPQAMLMRAKQVAISGEKFSLTGTNCSKVAGWVLSAGASTEKTKKIFSREALSKFATPQMVFNNALRYLRETSKKAQQKYDAMVEASLAKQPKPEITLPLGAQGKKAEYVPGFVEINFEGVQASLSDEEKCKVLFAKFEYAISEGDNIPYFPVETKLKVESLIKNNNELKSRFYALCDQSLMKARNQNGQFHQKQTGEWEEVKKIIRQQGRQEKISKKENPQLSRSYLVLEINGELKPFRVSSEILGKGAEGKVRIVESEDGLRYAVKIAPDKIGFDNEIELMKEAGAAIASFSRPRPPKESKSLGKVVGDKRYIVQPLFEGGELSSALRDKNMSKGEKLLLAEKVAEAIQRLHSKSILHRDIKPGNLMLTKDKDGIITQVDAIDFGGALKVPNPHGFVNSSRLGTPSYLAPEIDGPKIREKLNKWKTQESVVKQYGNMIIEADSHLKMLSNQQRSLEGEKNATINDLFIDQTTNDPYLSSKNREQVVNILKTYNGSNLLEIKSKISALAIIPSSKEAVANIVGKYCNIIDQSQSVQQSINFFQGKKVELESKLVQAKIDEKSFKKEFDDLYATKTNHSLPSDVYSLGIMLEKDFNLKLSDLGLEKMLAVDPQERPKMDEVQKILNTLSKPYKAKQDLPVLDVSPPSRLPAMVVPKVLKQNGLVLSPLQMHKLSTFRVDQKNAQIRIDNVTVFLSKEGGAFALYNQIQSGGTGATFLAQDLDTKQWVVMKMVQGFAHKIRGPLVALEAESKVLTAMNQHKGTLEIARDDGTELHISIQPYVHGKDYFKVIKNAKEHDPLSIEESVLMSLAAMEALVDIHEKGGLLHRDVKPENIMWDPTEKKCTFVDFGSAEKRVDPHGVVEDETIQGTEKYFAPELDYKILKKPDRIYSVKTDAYSMGVTIQELLSATKLSDNPAYHQLKQLQVKLTEVDPKKRITPIEALKELRSISHKLIDKKVMIEPIDRSREPVLMLRDTKTPIVPTQPSVQVSSDVEKKPPTVRTKI